MKYIFFLILSLVWACCINAQEQFEPYKRWTRGDSVFVGTVKWFAKRDIASAVAIPKENLYWGAARIILAPAPIQIDYKAKYDSVTTEYNLFRSRTQLEIDRLKQVIDSLSKPPIPPPTSGITEKKLSFSFSLATASTVSIGTYIGNTLINTIESNKAYKAGLHEMVIPYDSTAGLSVKILSNNLKYEWEGVLANTSDSISGPSVHHGYAQIYASLPYGDKLYVSKFYSEGAAIQNVLSLSNIQLSKRIFEGEPKGYSQTTVCMATDGVNLYWAGGDGYTTKSYVFATKISDNSEVIFPSGKPFRGYAGRQYKSVINFVDSISDINGIAAQKNGPYLFTARAKFNYISVTNKATGDSITTIPIGSPYGLACDEQDNLIVCTGSNVNKYKVNADGSIDMLLPINGFIRPISVSAKNGKILVADVADQTIKAFDYNGNSLWQFGQINGQMESAGIAFDKFYMLPNYASVALQDDGSFWLADIGNTRLLHFATDRKFIEQLLYTPHKYTSHVDPNNISSVFSDYSEFKVDYTKPLGKSWQLVTNWKPQVDSIVRRWYTAGLRPVTLSNGKRYTLLDYPRITVNGVIVKAHYKVFELTSNGIFRNTGITFPLVTPCTLVADGSVHVAPLYQLGQPTVFRKYTLTGFSNDNPIWSEAKTIATVNQPKADDPNNYPTNAGQITSNGTIVKYEQSQTANTYHLAGIKLGDTAYSFRTQPATSNNYAGIYPPDGAFDIGNGVVNAGNVAVVLDNLIFTGYKGEFWKASQVNKWNVYHESGLMIGQFGVTGPEATYEGYPEMAGNVFTGSIVKNGSDYYLYHNDEGHLSGIHRWKITGANTIQITTVIPKVINQPIDTNRIDLLANVPYDVVLNDSVAGYNRYPKTENYTDANINTWKIMTYTRSYEKQVPDIAVTYAGKKAIDSSFITRELGNNQTNTWALSGKISIGGSYNSVNASNQYDSLTTGSYLEILDNNSNPIIRLFNQQSKDRLNVNTYLNGQLIATDNMTNFINKVKDFNDFYFTVRDGLVTLNYLGITKTVKTTGNYSQPNKFRLYFFSKGGRLNRLVSIKEMYFNKM